MKKEKSHCNKSVSYVLLQCDHIICYLKSYQMHYWLKLIQPTDFKNNQVSKLFCVNYASDYAEKNIKFDIQSDLL